MKRTIGYIVPPHEPRSGEKLDSLVLAYESGINVTPVVVIELNDQLFAVSGSHRLAAMAQVYGVDADLDDFVDDEIIVEDGDSIYEEADADGDEILLDELSRLADGRATDFSMLIELLLPYLSVESKEALLDQ